MTRMVRLCLWLPVITALLVTPALGQEPAARPAPVITNPAARDLVATNPTEPSNIARVINSLIDLREAPAAAPLLTRLAGIEMDDAALLRFYREYGAGTLMKWSGQPALKAIADPFQEKILEAVKANVTDAEKINQRIANLANSARPVRLAAAEELTWGGEAASKALVGALADDAQAAAQAAMIDALVAMGVDCLPDLAAARDGDNSNVRKLVIGALARLKDDDANLLVLGPAFGEGEQDDQVRAIALRQATKLFGAELTSSQAAGRLYARAAELRHDENRLPLAEQLASDGLDILPHNTALRNVYLSILANAGDKQTAENFNEYDVATFESFLADALKRQDPRSAAFALAYLGNHGTESLLHQRESRPSTLVEAARAADPRIRMLALNAIAAIAPTQPFDGSSYVVESLEYFLRCRGKQQALVVDGRTAVARSRAGLLVGQGYEAEIAVDHRSALDVAIKTPDVEFVLIDITMLADQSAQLITALRRDNRTANLPVGILAPSDRYDEAMLMSSRLPLTVALIDAPTDQAAEFWVRQLKELPREKYIPTAARRLFLASALEWIATTGLPAPKVYDLSRCEPPLVQALHSAAVRGPALPIAAQFTSPQMQATLVELASAAIHSPETRGAALGALTESLSRYGILLTAVQLQSLYDRYNALGATDSALRTSIGAVLDIVEARARFDRARGPRVANDATAELESPSEASAAPVAAPLPEQGAPSKTDGS
ncbi:MAG: hypothetical protein JSS27_08090 [Planctomycetes bacterium]|nr:hypothetical protein [Planctomycetota bacterium]